MFPRARPHADPSSLSLDPLAALVFQHADGTRTVQGLAVLASRELHAEVDEEAVFAALDRLADADLLETRAAPPAGGRTVSRRQLVGGMGLAAAAAGLAATLLPRSAFAKGEQEIKASAETTDGAAHGATVSAERRNKTSVSARKQEEQTKASVAGKEESRKSPLTAGEQRKKASLSPATEQHDKKTLSATAQEQEKKRGGAGVARDEQLQKRSMTTAQEQKYKAKATTTRSEQDIKRSAVSRQEQEQKVK